MNAAEGVEGASQGRDAMAVGGAKGPAGDSVPGGTQSPRIWALWGCQDASLPPTGVLLTPWNGWGLMFLGHFPAQRGVTSFGRYSLPDQEAETIMGTLAGGDVQQVWGP